MRYAHALALCLLVLAGCATAARAQVVGGADVAAVVVDAPHVAATGFVGYRQGPLFGAVRAGAVFSVNHDPLRYRDVGDDPDNDSGSGCRELTGLSGDLGEPASHMRCHDYVLGVAGEVGLAPLRGLTVGGGYRSSEAFYEGPYGFGTLVLIGLGPGAVILRAETDGHYVGLGLGVAGGMR
jgi:hypothetical protein